MHKHRRPIRDFFSHYFNVLFLFLLLLFILRPYNKGPTYIIGWQLCYLGVLLSAIFNTRHSKATKIAAIVFAIPAFASDIMAHFYLSPAFEIIHLVCFIAFIFVCGWAVIKNVILNAKVSFDTLKGVICVYFMIGFMFAYLYVLIEFCIPNSFHLIKTSSLTDIYNFHDVRAQLIYFSFVTLLTIGFGDITALKDLGQSVAVIEGIIGQFYIAILVARIIAVYSYYDNKERHLL